MKLGEYECQQCGAVWEIEPDTLNEETQRKLAVYDELVETLEMCDAAGRAIFGNSAIGGRGNLSPEYEALRLACVHARAALAKSHLEPKEVTP